MNQGKQGRRSSEKLTFDNCIGYGDGENRCRAPVEYRMALSGTGIPYPRCEACWERRLALQEGLNRRYPEQPPSDSSPFDAGENWSEDDY